MSHASHAEQQQCRNEKRRGIERGRDPLKRLLGMLQRCRWQTPIRGDHRLRSNQRLPTQGPTGGRAAIQRDAWRGEALRVDQRRAPIVLYVFTMVPIPITQ